MLIQYLNKAIDQVRRREVKQHDELKHSRYALTEEQSEPHRKSGGYIPGHPEIELASQYCLEAKRGVQGHLSVPHFRGCKKVLQTLA